MDDDGDDDNDDDDDNDSDDDNNILELEYPEHSDLTCIHLSFTGLSYAMIYRSTHDNSTLHTIYLSSIYPSVYLSICVSSCMTYGYRYRWMDGWFIRHLPCTSSIPTHPPPTSSSVLMVTG